MPATALATGGKTTLHTLSLDALWQARETILEVASKFRMIPYNRLLITKQDEAARHGVLLDLFQMARIPVSYITYGQEVPDDFHPASEERLVNLLLGE